VLLEGKSAIVYGGGGPIGGAAGRGFAREGARVFLAGRTGARRSRSMPSSRCGGSSPRSSARKASAS
jgi:3-oxoacyl-[acyl-carrier protein] reductase